MNTWREALDVGLESDEDDEFAPVTDAEAEARYQELSIDNPTQMALVVPSTSFFVLGSGGIQFSSTVVMTPAVPPNPALLQVTPVMTRSKAVVDFALALSPLARGLHFEMINSDLLARWRAQSKSVRFGDLTDVHLFEDPVPVSAAVPMCMGSRSLMAECEITTGPRRGEAHTFRLVPGWIDLRGAAVERTVTQSRRGEVTLDETTRVEGTEELRLQFLDVSPPVSPGDACHIKVVVDQNTGLVTHQLMWATVKPTIYDVPDTLESFANFRTVLSSLGLSPNRGLFFTQLENIHTSTITALLESQVAELLWPAMDLELSKLPLASPSPDFSDVIGKLPRVWVERFHSLDKFCRPDGSGLKRGVLTPGAWLCAIQFHLVTFRHPESLLQAKDPAPVAHLAPLTICLIQITEPLLRKFEVGPNRVADLHPPRIIPDFLRLATREHFQGQVPLGWRSIAERKRTTVDLGPYATILSLPALPPEKVHTTPSAASRDLDPTNPASWVVWILEFILHHHTPKEGQAVGDRVAKELMYHCGAALEGLLRPESSTLNEVASQQARLRSSANASFVASVKPLNQVYTQAPPTGEPSKSLYAVLAPLLLRVYDCCVAKKLRVARIRWPVPSLELNFDFRYFPAPRQPFNSLFKLRETGVTLASLLDTALFPLDVNVTNGIIAWVQNELRDIVPEFDGTIPNSHFARIHKLLTDLATKLGFTLVYSMTGLEVVYRLQYILASPVRYVTIAIQSRLSDAASFGTGPDPQVAISVTNVAAVIAATPVELTDHQNAVSAVFDNAIAGLRPRPLVPPANFIAGLERKVARFDEYYLQNAEDPAITDLPFVHNAADGTLVDNLPLISSEHYGQLCVFTAAGLIPPAAETNYSAAPGGLVAERVKRVISFADGYLKSAASLEPTKLVTLHTVSLSGPLSRDILSALLLARYLPTVTVAYPRPHPTAVQEHLPYEIIRTRRALFVDPLTLRHHVESFLPTGHYIVDLLAVERCRGFLEFLSACHALRLDATLILPHPMQPGKYMTMPCRFKPLVAAHPRVIDVCLLARPEGDVVSWSLVSSRIAYQPTHPWTSDSLLGGLATTKRQSIWQYLSKGRLRNLVGSSALAFVPVNGVQRATSTPVRKPATGMWVGAKSQRVKTEDRTAADLTTPAAHNVRTQAININGDFAAFTTNNDNVFTAAELYETEADATAGIRKLLRVHNLVTLSRMPDFFHTWVELVNPVRIFDFRWLNPAFRFKVELIRIQEPFVIDRSDLLGLPLLHFVAGLGVGRLWNYLQFVVGATKLQDLKVDIINAMAERLDADADPDAFVAGQAAIEVILRALRPAEIAPGANLTEPDLLPASQFSDIKTPLVLTLNLVPAVAIVYPVDFQEAIRTTFGVTKFTQASLAAFYALHPRTVDSNHADAILALMCDQDLTGGGIPVERQRRLMASTDLSSRVAGVFHYLKNRKSANHTLLLLHFMNNLDPGTDALWRFVIWEQLKRRYSLTPAVIAIPSFFAHIIEVLFETTPGGSRRITVLMTKAGPPIATVTPGENILLDRLLWAVWDVYCCSMGTLADPTKALYEPILLDAIFPHLLRVASKYGHRGHARLLAGLLLIGSHPIRVEARFARCLQQLLNTVYGKKFSPGLLDIASLMTDTATDWTTKRPNTHPAKYARTPAAPRMRLWPYLVSPLFFWVEPSQDLQAWYTGVYSLYWRNPDAWTPAGHHVEWLHMAVMAEFEKTEREIEDVMNEQDLDYPPDVRDYLLLLGRKPVKRHLGTEGAVEHFVASADDDFNYLSSQMLVGARQLAAGQVHPPLNPEAAAHFANASIQLGDILARLTALEITVSDHNTSITAQYNAILAQLTTPAATPAPPDVNQIRTVVNDALRVIMTEFNLRIDTLVQVAIEQKTTTNDMRAEYINKVNTIKTETAAALRQVSDTVTALKTENASGMRDMVVELEGKIGNTALELERRDAQSELSSYIKALDGFIKLNDSAISPFLRRFFGHESTFTRYENELRRVKDLDILSEKARLATATDSEGLNAILTRAYDELFQFVSPSTGLFMTYLASLVQFVPEENRTTLEGYILELKAIWTGFVRGEKRGGETAIRDLLLGVTTAFSKETEKTKASTRQLTAAVAEAEGSAGRIRDIITALERDPLVRAVTDATGTSMKEYLGDSLQAALNEVMGRATATFQEKIDAMGKIMENHTRKLGQQSSLVSKLSDAQDRLVKQDQRFITELEELSRQIKAQTGVNAGQLQAIQDSERAVREALAAVEAARTAVNDVNLDEPRRQAQEAITQAVALAREDLMRTRGTLREEVAAEVKTTTALFEARLAALTHESAAQEVTKGTLATAVADVKSLADRITSYVQEVEAIKRTQAELAADALARNAQVETVSQAVTHLTTQGVPLSGASVAQLEQYALHLTGLAAEVKASEANLADIANYIKSYGELMQQRATQLPRIPSLRDTLVGAKEVLAERIQTVVNKLTAEYQVITNQLSRDLDPLALDEVTVALVNQLVEKGAGSTVLFNRILFRLHDHLRDLRIRQGVDISQVKTILANFVDMLTLRAPSAFADVVVAKNAQASLSFVFPEVPAISLPWAVPPVAGTLDDTISGSVRGVFPEAVMALLTSHMRSDPSSVAYRSLAAWSIITTVSLAGTADLTPTFSALVERHRQFDNTVVETPIPHLNFVQTVQNVSSELVSWRLNHYHVTETGIALMPGADAREIWGQLERMARQLTTVTGTGDVSALLAYCLLVSDIAIFNSYRSLRGDMRPEVITTSWPPEHMWSLRADVVTDPDIVSMLAKLLEQTVSRLQELPRRIQNTQNAAFINGDWFAFPNTDSMRFSDLDESAISTYDQCSFDECVLDAAYNTDGYTPDQEDTITRLRQTRPNGLVAFVSFASKLMRDTGVFDDVLGADTKDQVVQVSETGELLFQPGRMDQAIDSGQLVRAVMLHPAAPPS